MKIPRIKIIFWSVLLSQLFSNCERKNDPNNQIIIKLNSIDSKTKKLRVNTFDTIELRIESFGFPKKQFPKVAEYITDSSGSVKIKIDRTEKYLLLLGAPFIFGSENIVGENMKEGQEINIEAIHIQ